MSVTTAASLAAAGVISAPSALASGPIWVQPLTVACNQSCTAQAAAASFVGPTQALAHVTFDGVCADTTPYTATSDYTLGISNLETDTYYFSTNFALVTSQQQNATSVNVDFEVTWSDGSSTSSDLAVNNPNGGGAADCAAITAGSPTLTSSDTGVADVGPDVAVVSESDAAGIEAKEQWIQQLQVVSNEYLAADATGTTGTTGTTGVSGVPTLPLACIPACPATTYDLPSQPLHKEGEGDGNKIYTCGPASTRNLVQQMTGTDYGEAQFSTWEGTTRSGTTMGGIVSTLNNHFRSYDGNGWYARTPGGPTDLLATVVGDTYYWHHGTVLNVLTTSLSFWHRHATLHYDLAYGYDHSSGGHIRIAEEWDPTLSGVYTWPNPYGYHNEPVANVYAAVRGSPTQQVAT